ncbi:endonuclease/exonuclease/phosphatase family protein [Streptomyces sp. NBC_01768]|uniref:endonuclease/exonuclease/phosphatase family protein n=1 Tax=Streptomyces sp. NBC_01768 TaxID=2975938 RepID=UPI002DDAD153|nr:endonuclease/exonuclease/phosphatase family protein [Streptomyces sp. NBC_01768]WSC25748.1 endonuclease/exonuclease/phosphatase family protein [Streptomyces sp. NBC_01768]
MTNKTYSQELPVECLTERGYVQPPSERRELAFDFCVIRRCVVSRAWNRCALIMVAALTAATALAATGTASATSAGSRTSAAGRDVTVMTFNIHHGADPDDVLNLDHVAQAVRQSGADVIGLQEVDRHFASRSDFVDQAEWLANRLGLHLAYGTNLDLDPEKPSDPRRRYGTAVLSRFPIVNTRNTLLPRSEAGEQRGLLEADLMIRGKKMRFLNTHLEDTSQAERRTQVAAINAIVNGSRLPTVLVGDLNATPDSDEIASVTKRLTDTWPTAGKGDGFTYDSVNPRERIDYVFASSGVEARRARVLDVTVSDHRPLRVELTIR